MRDANSREPDRPAEPGRSANAGHGDDGRDPEPPHAPLTAEFRGARAEPASVHVIMETDRTRIVLSGEVDADLAAELREATADAEATGLPIEVDAHHVTFMDSSGIAFLARIATRSADRVRVIRAPENVRLLLDVTRIGELLDVVDAPDQQVGPPAAEQLEAEPVGEQRPTGEPVGSSTDDAS